MASGVKGVGVDQSNHPREVPLLLELLEDAVNIILLMPVGLLALLVEVALEAVRLGFEIFVFAGNGGEKWISEEEMERKGQATNRSWSLK